MPFKHNNKYFKNIISIIIYIILYMSLNVKSKNTNISNPIFYFQNKYYFNTNINQV